MIPDVALHLREETHVVLRTHVCEELFPSDEPSGVEVHARPLTAPHSSVRPRDSLQATVGLGDGGGLTRARGAEVRQ